MKRLLTVAAVTMVVTAGALAPSTASAAGTDAVAVIDGYAINTYTDSYCTRGHSVLAKGQGHQYGIHSVKVNAVGYFTTNMPDKPIYSFGPANACKKINQGDPDWTDTHIAATDHG